MNYLFYYYFAILVLHFVGNKATVFVYIIDHGAVYDPTNINHTKIVEGCGENEWCMEQSYNIMKIDYCCRYVNKVNSSGVGFETGLYYSHAIAWFFILIAVVTGLFAMFILFVMVSFILLKLIER